MAKKKDKEKIAKIKTSDKSGAKVGVVIPLYNTPLTYLRKCIMSVMQQDYDNLEILLIHDGNYAPCVEVAKEYARVDVRISILVKSLNEGSCVARNIALDYFNGALEFTSTKSKEEGLQTFTIKGNNPYGIQAAYKATTLKPSKIDYIYFLDSDDIIAKDLISHCLKVANDADIVWFNLEKIFEKGCENLAKDSKIAMVIQSLGEITPCDLFNAYKENLQTMGEIVILQNLGQLFIDFKFLQNTTLRFLNQVMKGEDLFGICLLIQAQKIYTLPHSLLAYRVRSGSETHFARDFNNLFVPGYLSPLYQAFSGDILLTKYFYYCLSGFIQKIYFLNFMQQYTQMPNIDGVISGVLAQLRKQSLAFMDFAVNGSVESYYQICFKVFLGIIKDVVNDGFFLCPLRNLEKSLGASEANQEIGLIYEALEYLNTKITSNNAILEQLKKRKEELEAKNLELKSMQK